tara:strand:- start:698 stop:1078 length:381 start_codon:yes stop_codon:yes gene_type:complete
MTCFWDSILSSLNDEDLRILGTNRHRKNLIIALKNKNKITTTLWQGSNLSQKEREESFDAVKDYNIKGIFNGHLTSICDYFLLLISDLLNLSIEHRFLNTKIIYTPLGNVRRHIKFKSNNGHFSKN